MLKSIRVCAVHLSGGYITQRHVGYVSVCFSALVVGHGVRWRYVRHLVKSVGGKGILQAVGSFLHNPYRRKQPQSSSWIIFAITTLLSAESDRPPSFFFDVNGHA